jgi:general secretion pathway protein A
LLESYASDKTVLLIVDEAQRLNNELLEQIRLLSNIELDNHKLLNIFFVGQNEFNQLLRDGRNKAVRQRISVFYQLNPLTESETGTYIRHRLERAGGTEEIFKPDAIKAIFKFSNGTPRLINLICDLALLTGFTRELKKINAEVIKDCDKELQIPMDLVKITPKPPKPKEEHSALNQAVVQRKEPTGIKGGIIFIGIVFFLFVAYQIYESMTDKPFFSKQEQVETQKKFEPSEDVSTAFEAQKEEIENTKSEDAEPLTTPPKEEIADTKSEDAEPLTTPQKEEIADTKFEDAEPLTTPQKEEIADTKSEDAEPLTAAQKEEEPRSTVVPVSDTENNDAVNQQISMLTETPADAVVDQKAIIQFDHNSNELPENAYQTLDSIVKLTSQYPNLKITVEGYTDSYGSRIYNRQLSQYRADMVKNYLIGHGVAPSQISSRGRGPENPIKSNATRDGRKQNRRVEISVNSE